MNIILLIVAWLVGLVASAIFLIQPLILLFFAIPFTKKLRRIGAISWPGPIPSYLGSLIILPVIFLLITWGAYTWLPKQIIAYWFGVGFVLISGIKKCGQNPTNMAEYLQTNAKYLNQDTLDQIHETYGTKSP